jgi:glycosyltransferase involved in cell wall biosynthesis
MACGTPVIAFPEGSAPELVLDGETGFIVEDEQAMADAIRRLDEIDPARCRSSAEERFDAAPVAEAYERAYESVSREHAHPFVDDAS